MTKISGTYAVDLEGSAKLLAGFFDERFVMKPGYHESIKQFMLENGEAADGISLSIDATRLMIRSPEGEEEFPVLELDETASPARLMVDWLGETAFDVVEVAPGSIHLRNPTNELSSWIWRRVSELSEGGPAV